MSLLLDTHAFLWLATGSPKLSRRARETIDAETDVLALSMGSVWEMAIKVSIGKLALAGPIDPTVQLLVEACRVSLQAITIAQLDRVATLPFPPSGHKDPFDRLIAAQALELGWELISADAAFDEYGVPRVW